LTRNDYSSTDYGSCIPCSSGCLECNNENFCTKCVLNENRVAKDGFCECTASYKENPLNKKCEYYESESVTALKETATVAGNLTYFFLILII
jgi:hypothetical protein